MHPRHPSVPVVDVSRQGDIHKQQRADVKCTGVRCLFAKLDGIDRMACGIARSPPTLRPLVKYRTPAQSPYAWVTTTT